MTFALAFAAAAGLSALVRKVAKRTGAVVPVRADRWHHQPTPTFGGVAIAAATLSVAAASVALSGLPARWVDAALVASTAAALFGVGFLDDRLRLTPLTKLLATLTAGAVLLFGLSTVSGAALGWWQTVLAVIWFAGVVHAFNLLDNMDGLAGGVALIAAAALAAIFRAELGALLAVTLVATAGSAGGFLVWNVKPARLFMGDCGSLFLGAVLAGSSLVLALRAPSLVGLDGLSVGLVLVVPLLDTSFVLVLRRLAGRGPARGGTDHVSHRLVSAGLSERKAVGALYLLGATGAVLAWSIRSDGDVALAVSVLFAVGVLLVGIYLARFPAYDGEDFQALQKWSFAPFLRDLTFRWHALEMLLDVVLISAVFYLSYRLRFEDEALDVFITSFTASLPIVLACKLLALHVAGVYSSLWGSFSVRDAFVIVRGVALGSVASIFVAAYLYRFERFSRGVFVIDAALLTLVLLGVRGSFRAMGEAMTGRNSRARRALVYGAGSGGQFVVREARANAEWGLNPIAFLDDDPAKYGRRLLGLPIKGNAEMLESVIARCRIEEVVISSSIIDAERETYVRETCTRLGIPVRHFRLEIV